MFGPFLENIGRVLDQYFPSTDLALVQQYINRVRAFGVIKDRTSLNKHDNCTTKWQNAFNSVGPTNLLVFLLKILLSYMNPKYSQSSTIDTSFNDQYYYGLGNCSKKASVD